MSAVIDTCPAPVSEAETAQAPMFFVVSIPKLIVMSIFAGPMYWTYWYYRAWQNCRERTGERIWPLGRALLGGLMIYGLLKRVNRQLELSGKPAMVSAGWMTCLCFALMAMQTVLIVLDEFMPHLSTALIVASLALIIPGCWMAVRMQRAINYACGDENGLSNNQLTVWNYLWMVIGTLPLVSQLLLSVN